MGLTTVQGRIILKLNLEKQVMKMWIGLNWLGNGIQRWSFCEHHTRPPGSVKVEHFLMPVLSLHPEYWGSMDLRNVVILPQHHTASQPKKTSTIKFIDHLPVSIFGKPQVQMSARHLGIPWFSSEFPSKFHDSALNRPRSFPSSSLLINHSQIIPLFHAK